jgi:hypothetical protein
VRLLALLPCLCWLIRQLELALAHRCGNRNAQFSARAKRYTPGFAPRMPFSN